MDISDADLLAAAGAVPLPASLPGSSPPSPTPYERTKEQLLLLQAPSRWVMASRILHHPHLGDTWPSVLMSKMLVLLLLRGEPPSILFQTAWLEWLPADLRSQVSTHDFTDVRAMAAFADRVWETRSAKVFCGGPVPPQPLSLPVAHGHSVPPTVPGLFTSRGRSQAAWLPAGYALLLP